MKHVQLFEQFLNEDVKAPKAFATDKTKVKKDEYTTDDFKAVLPDLKKAGRAKVPTRPDNMAPMIEITPKKLPIKITYMAGMGGYWVAYLQNSKGRKLPIISVYMSLEEFVDAVNSIK